MRLTFSVPGKAPSLNDILRAKGSGHHAYNELKKKWCKSVADCAKAAATYHLPQYNFPIKGKSTIRMTVIEENRKRDPDNVSAGARKFLHDGLVKAGILESDRPAHVNGDLPTMVVYAKRPSIIATVVWEHEGWDG